MRFIDALPSVFWMSAAAFIFAYMLAVALTSLVGGDTDTRHRHFAFSKSLVHAPDGPKFRFSLKPY